MRNTNESITKLPFSFPVYLTFFLVSLGLSLTSCKGTKYTGETISYKPAESGLIYIKSGGYGSTKPSSVNNGIENAFKNIFLKGIPSSNQSTPLLGNNATEVFERNKAFFDNFLKNEKDQFIVERQVSAYHFLNINSPSTEVTMTVNLQSLRQHLIQNKILRSFGI